MEPVAAIPYEDIELAYTVSGSGPPLILLHGWPFHKASFRKLLPLLERHFTCYAPDAAGMGDSSWSAGTNFSFLAHAERVRALADRLGLDRFALIGHDTGGTIARIVAAREAERVTRLVLLDTELPRHDLPMLRRLQRISRYRIGRMLLRRKLNSENFVRSSQGFGTSFADPKQLDDEFVALFVRYWLASERRFMGLLKYLQGIDFDFVDRLDEIHAKIKAPVLVLWGEDDPIFPTALGEAMPSCAGFAAIPATRFLPHEERPAEVAERVVAFLGEKRNAVPIPLRA